MSDYIGIGIPTRARSDVGTMRPPVESMFTLINAFSELSPDVRLHRNRDPDSRSERRRDYATERSLFAS